MAWVGGAAAAKAPPNEAKKPSGFSVWRLIRWLILLALVLVVVQVLRRPAPPLAVQRTPQERAADAAAFRTKLDALQRAHNEGTPGLPARFSENELNAYIEQSVAEISSNATSNVPSNAQAETAAAALVRTVKAPTVTLAGDEITVQMTVERFGKEFIFSLSGRLGTQHEASQNEGSYVAFHPTSCKLGLVSIPLGLVDKLVQQKLAEPENREKMKLPEFIQSVRVENGELVVMEK
ncbi:MAG: hypothetical protein M3P27_01990 [Acidobacteriota bacterium]|nr:hypothetical protein [Acidobacteriota bacterium]